MTDNAPPAVEVAGFLRSGLGLGEAARLYVEALRSAGVPVHTTTVDLKMPDVQAARKKTVDFEDVEHAGERPISLICVNAPELGQFRAQVGDAFFDRPRNIGSWAWEVDKVPAEWLPLFGAFDEIWVYSRYVAENLAAAAPSRIERVPLPIVEPQASGPAPDLGLPEKYTFLFMFDFFSTLKRKNPLGLIEAFKRAFRPGEGPQLVLKSFNGDYKPDRLTEVESAAADHPDIHVVDRYVTGAEKDALVAACDCYVSLHRAEGFGLTLGEAMVLGKPVIATNFSGNTDFMTAENSYLVDWSLTTVGEGGDNYPADGHWAEPDLDHAAALMREVWEDAEAARERGGRAREEIMRDWSLEAVGEIARDRLEAVALTSSEHSRLRRVLPRAPGALEGAESKLAYDLAEDDTGAGLRRAARRLSLQAMRPYTYHQDELNALLVLALRDTSDRLDRLAVEVLADVRELLHAARARPGAAHPAITAESEHGEPVLAFDRATEGPDLADVRFEDINLFQALSFGHAQAIARAAIEDFGGRDVDAVYLLYNEFKSVLQQRIVVEQLLPIPRAELEAGQPAVGAAIDYLYEPEPEQILRELLPRHVEIQVFRALLESSAAEHAARMTAMDTATKNSAEMIDSLTLYMNKVRQAAITREIIEVVSGAQAQ